MRLPRCARNDEIPQIPYLYTMKKPKAQRRALRAKKYEEKLISNFSFSDLTTAAALNAQKLEKIKASKQKRSWKGSQPPTTK